MIVYFYHLHTCTYRVWTLSSAICHTTPAAATMLKCTSTRKSTVAWVADCYINQTLIDGRNYYYHSNINLFLPALQLDRPVPLYKEDTEDFNLHICRLCTILVASSDRQPQQTTVAPVLSWLYWTHWTSFVFFLSPYASQHDTCTICTVSPLLLYLLDHIY